MRSDLAQKTPCSLDLFSFLFQSQQRALGGSILRYQNIMESNLKSVREKQTRKISKLRNMVLNSP
jgi:hypothetical protein